MALNAYSAIDPASGKNIGGLESTAWQLAKNLSQSPMFEVSMVVRHNRPLDLRSVAGVELELIVDRFRDLRLDVSRQIKPSRSFPWLAIQSWSWRLPFQLVTLLATRWFRDRRETAVRVRDALKNSRADVLVAFGNGQDPATLVRYGLDHGVPSLVLLQSNADLDDRYFGEVEFINSYGEPSDACRYVLENASELVGQTCWQQQRIMELVNRPARILATPVDDQIWAAGPASVADREFVLWVGRADRFHKRPHLAVDIAHRFPQASFVMVMNKSDAEVESEIRRKAPGNVRFKDYVPKDEMPKLMRRAKAFLSTGAAEFEGLPNVFLEAASCGTPIVTMNDFGDFVFESGAGAVAEENVEHAARCLRAILENIDGQWQKASLRGQSWVRERHSLIPIIDRMGELIRETVSSNSDVGGA